MALGVAGALSLAGGASASISSASDKPTQNTAPVILAEEEISDVSLSTFYVFDKENAGARSERLAAGRGGGGHGGCGGRGCGGRGCGGRGCGGCRGCGGGGAEAAEECVLGRARPGPASSSSNLGSWLRLRERHRSATPC